MPSLVRLIIWYVVIRKGDLYSIRFYKQTMTEKRKGKIDDFFQPLAKRKQSKGKKFMFT
jgi:hypothetical protein